LFAPLPELVCAFDAVVSFGLVEHFLPTQQVIEALANFVKPGGIVVTVVPNIAGWLGSLQKRLDKVIYEMHVPLTPEALASAHADAGLQVLEARHVSTADFYVAIGPSKPPAAPFARMGLIAMRLLSKGFWLFENVTGWGPHSASLSPYVGCAARKS
jgi:SAM-dependent methyltransferase